MNVSSTYACVSFSAWLKQRPSGKRLFFFLLLVPVLCFFFFLFAGGPILTHTQLLQTLQKPTAMPPLNLLKPGLWENTLPTHRAKTNPGCGKGWLKDMNFCTWAHRFQASPLSLGTFPAGVPSPFGFSQGRVQIPKPPTQSTNWREADHWLSQTEQIARTKHHPERTRVKKLQRPGLSRTVAPENKQTQKNLFTPILLTSERRWPQSSLNSCQN